MQELFGISLLLRYPNGPTQYEIVLAKLNDGIDINTRDSEGRTVLSLIHNHSDKCLFLLMCGADVNLADNLGTTPLMRICRYVAYMQSIGLLLDYGADPNRMDKFDRTALDIALLHGNFQAASLLLKYGADIDQADSEGNTALMKLCAGNWRSFNDAILFLLQRGANVNAKNKLDRTPLMIYLDTHLNCNALELVQLLIVFGADGRIDDITTTLLNQHRR